MKKAPATTAKRLNSPRQYRTVRALQQGPKTVMQLEELAGGTTAPDLILNLRNQKGLVIHTQYHEGTDRDGRSTRYCTYELDPESAELADELISEYLSRTSQTDGR